MLKSKKLLVFLFLLFIVLLLMPVSLAAEDKYKPYLHKPNIPEHPKVKLYGKYQTELFPGAGTYTYEIEVPKGTNNLQPSLTIYYNSQSVKQRPSILGAGWTLPQSYIYRDVNFTPSNTTDDEFKLILNGASYDLIYSLEDNFFHTETETFARIQNLSNETNTYSQYWLVTLKDGTQLRFGYANESELTSNTGYNYALKWSLDLIEDTHNNKIFYSYNKNPYPQDNSSVYLSAITYNNDEKRKIEFSYENTNRPDRRLVFEQGNALEETRRLTDISTLFNNTLVRRYHFEFNNLNNEKTLSSLKNISYIGSDNISVLHTINFAYYTATSFYHNSTVYNVSIPFQHANGTDLGLRLADINGDGFIDILQGSEAESQKRIWLNNKSGWSQDFSFTLPDYFVDSFNNDNGLRIDDLNLDGFPDLIQGSAGLRRAWLNNGSNFSSQNVFWAPPINFVGALGEDLGVQLVDFNADGKVDILQSREKNNEKFAFLNTGSGWKNASSIWISPVYFSRDDATGSDFGARLVDVNADGLVDILEGHNFSTVTRRAYLNNGSGWVNNTEFIPPDVFTSTARLDNGIRLIDLNGDGLVDIFQDYANGTTLDRDAWINNGTGWKMSGTWNSPEPFTRDGKNIGRRIGDVNGDGFGDIIVGHNSSNYTIVRNETFPYLLKNITNELGGATYLYYSPSTIFNNSNGDGLSDIGFNIWVIRAALDDNGINGSFNVKANTSYNYLYGKYDYVEGEFRGFSIVNETLADNITIIHYFHQTNPLKGREFRAETYDKNGNLFLKTESNYNVTNTNSSISIVNLNSISSYLYDGNTESPKITNVSYKYDNYSNVIGVTNFGDIFISGDEKYENYSYTINSSIWILDKLSRYAMFDSNYNKLRETKYYYDNALDSVKKGDLTKREDYLDDGTGNPTIYYAYDSFGNPYRQTDALGRTIVYDYGSKDSTNTYPDRRINELGHAVDYNYDIATGNILSFIKHGVAFSNEYDTFGRIIKEINPYDSSNLPTKKYEYIYDGIAPEIIKVSQKTTSNNTIDVYYYYDGFANLIQIKTPAENNQQIIKNIFYDSLFRVKEEQNPYFSTFALSLSNKSNTTNITKYQYDTLSRITKVTNPDGTFKQTNYNKNQIDDYDENSNKHTYLLDAHDRIISVTEYNQDYYLLDNETYNTTYSYNGADELTGIRDAYGNYFNFTYNSLGQKIQLDDPDLGIWKYEYDFAGNLIKQTDNKGNAVNMGYDGLNRIQHKNTSSQAITFAYDVQYHGTLHNISFDNITFTYTYDDRLRVIKEELRARNQNFITGVTYDSADRILEKRLPDNDDLDYYYNAQSKLSQIRGYINQTSYNPFGNPLNRTYFNAKLTEFDYYSDNARLRQIKTDTIQSLNYTYDSVGNILSINDSANNRSYKMSYDNLDRLTNVTINGFSWVYNYDAIGNILKIIRNSSQTTSLKYDSSLAHAPVKVITKDTGIDVYRHSDYNISNKTKIFQFYLINEKNTSLVNVNWTAEFGDNSTIDSNQLFSLSLKENVLIIVQHNYTKGSNYRINFTGRSSATANDYETLKLLFGAAAKGLEILKKNASLIITEFDVKNLENEFSQNWGWNCSNGVLSTLPFNMSSNQELLVIMEHNYSLSSLTHNLTCKINSTDGNQSITLPFSFNNILIENYNSTLKGDSAIEVQFQIKNYFGTLNVEWNLTAKDQVFKSSAPISLAQGETTTIIQEINFTNRGVKPLKITVFSGNLTDTYSESIRLYSLDITDFLNIAKNGTTRIFNFIIKNDWINLTAYWNISNPEITNIVNLTSNESLIVVIEENFGQGKKNVEIKLFNQTFLEDKITETFTIKHIGINEFETLHQNSSNAITSALVVNNINPVNISWKLNNTEALITSTQNLELNTSEQGIIVIESNFSSSGIYPLNFIINQSTNNDNATGVAVS